MKNILYCLGALLSLTISTSHIQAQTPAKNKTFVLKAYQEMSDNHNTGYFATGLGGYIPYWPGEGRRLKAAFAEYFAAIPDAKFIVENAIAEGNTVTVELLSTGTLKNKFMDWEPSGKPFSFRSTHTLSFDNNGKITEGWPFPDPALYLR